MYIVRPSNSFDESLLIGGNEANCKYPKTRERNPKWPLVVATWKGMGLKCEMSSRTAANCSILIKGEWVDSYYIENTMVRGSVLLVQPDYFLIMGMNTYNAHSLYCDKN